MLTHNSVSGSKKIGFEFGSIVNESNMNTMYIVKRTELTVILASAFASGSTGDRPDELNSSSAAGLKIICLKDLFV